MLGAKLDAQQDAAQRSLNKRFEIYTEAGELINDLYCYFAYVGNWNELTPDDIISKRKKLDAIMYTYRPLFSKKLFARYRQFMSTLFQKRVVNISDENFSINEPQFRTAIKFRKEAASAKRIPWDEKWNVLYTGEENQQQKAHKAFYAIQDILAEELGLLK